MVVPLPYSRSVRRLALLAATGLIGIGCVAMVPVPMPTPGPPPTPASGAGAAGTGASAVAGSPSPVAGAPAVGFTPVATATGVRFVPPSLGATIEAARPSPSAVAASPSPTAVVPPPSGVVPYGAVQTIFNARCIACHGGAAGMDLRGSGAAQIVNVRSREQPSLMRVSPGSPDLSYLWLKVSQPNPPSSQRMPRNGDPLLPDELETIRLWIAQGASTG